MYPLCTPSWQCLFSPLWGRCIARPCSWNRGVSESPAGPAAGHWPLHPLCSCPALAYIAPPCLTSSPLPCHPVVQASHHLSPEWACGCRWIPPWLRAHCTPSLQQQLTATSVTDKKDQVRIAASVERRSKSICESFITWPVFSIFLKKCWVGSELDPITSNLFFFWRCHNWMSVKILSHPDHFSLGCLSQRRLDF